MSSPLAIAAVTHVIKEILRNGINDPAVQGLAGMNANVTATAPDKIDLDTHPNSLNIYMYMTRPNSGWRNRDLPSRDSQGRHISNPYLALDLHFVLSAYGNEELNSDILLGYGMHLLHENYILIRDEITAMLTPQSGGGTLPPRLEALATSGIAEQIEQIKISPENLNTEEFTRIWTSFGEKYRQSAFYMASTVLIESTRSTRLALPVQRSIILVRPFERPIISKISSRTASNTPIIDNQKIIPGYQIVVSGTQLKGEITSVLVDGNEVQEADFVLLSDKQIIFPVPTGLETGIQSVQVIHKIEMSDPPEARQAFSSNVQAFVLSPNITNPTEVNVQVDGTNQTAVRVSIDPLPGPKQQVTLFLNEQTANNPRSYSFKLDTQQDISPAGPAGSITIPIQDVAASDYLVNIRVDNAVSPIAADFQSPNVTIAP